VATAATMGVRVNGLGQYRFIAADTEVDPDPRPAALVLGFGNVSEHQIIRGLDGLAKAVRQVSSAMSGRSGGLL